MQRVFNFFKLDNKKEIYVWNTSKKRRDNLGVTLKGYSLFVLWTLVKSLAHIFINYKFFQIYMATYSHSRIGTFENCPLKYKFKYIDKIKPEEIENTIEAFLGSMVHLVFEKLYNDLKFQKKNTKDELIDYFSTQWKKNFNDGVLIVREGYCEENYFEMGKKYISDYFDRYFPFDDSVTIECEKKILIKLSDKYYLQGYIDRLSYRKDGVFEIHDYKTANHLPSQEELDCDRQLALYAISVKEMFTDASDIELVWHYVAFDKEMRSKRTFDELLALKQEVLSQINQIEKETSFEPKESALCKWCEFQPNCPRKAHLFKLSKKSAKEYISEDGVMLANQYAKLSKQKGEIEKEMESIKERIMSYSKRNNVDILYGSDVKIKIWCGANIKVTDNQILKEELFKVLKDNGLWDKVCDFSSFRLSKLFSSKEISEIHKSIIAPYVSPEKIYRLYLSSFEGPRD